MMRKQNMWKMAITGALLLTVIATGVTMYGTSDEVKDNEGQRNETEFAKGDEDKDRDANDVSDNNAGNDADSNDANAGNDANAVDDVQDTSGNSVTAENYNPADNHLLNPSEPAVGGKDGEKNNNADKNSNDNTNLNGNNDDKDTSATVLPALNFSEDSVMVWPVNASKVLIDYSMDRTTYFATLNQYKCSNGLVLGSEVGTAVQAAANGKVLSVTENAETGLTVTMDLGNGYEAIYGQLKDVRVDAGQTLEKGVILGYVEDPTKYFVKEGSNLYFAMKKDGAYVDPMLYLETGEE